MRKSSLPITTGVALLWGTRSWRPFVGRWLLIAGVLALGSLLWLLRAYQGWPLTIVVGFVVCGLPPLLCAMLLHGIEHAGLNVKADNENARQPLRALELP